METSRQHGSGSRSQLAEREARFEKGTANRCFGPSCFVGHRDGVLGPARASLGATLGEAASNEAVHGRRPVQMVSAEADSESGGTGQRGMDARHRDGKVRDVGLSEKLRRLARGRVRDGGNARVRAQSRRSAFAGSRCLSGDTDREERKLT